MRPSSRLEPCPEAQRHPPSLVRDTGGRRTEEAQQLSLSPALHWAEKGARLRALLNRTIDANNMQVVDLSEATEIDEKQIGRALSGNGSHPPLALLACVLWQDRRGIFLSALADSLGYELTPKKPDLAAENRRLRDALAQAITALQGVTSP